MAFPQAKIFARIFDRRHLLTLDEHQIEGMFRKVLESAISMARPIPWISMEQSRVRPLHQGTEPRP